MADQKRICLIDLSGIARQYWHATEHEGASAMVGKTLQAVTGFAAGFDHVGICVDTPPYKRAELSAEYKAAREKVPAVYFEMLSRIVDQLDRDGFHIIGSRGYEADDILATLVAKLTGVVIYSADKDLLSLVRPGVEVISSSTGTVYADEDAVVAKLGVKPELVPDWLALVGDKSDGIPGVYGVGPKTAAAWLTQWGGLDQVLANADKLEPARFREAVAAGKDIIGKSFLLAQLMDDAPINPEVLLTTKEIKRDEPNAEPFDIEPVAPATPPGSGHAPQSTAMANVASSLPEPTIEFERQLEPRDSGGAMRLAQYLFSSRMFGQFPTPEAILAIILAGRAHGLGAFQSLQGFYNIQGRPSASAQMIVGLVKRHSVCRYFRLVESTPERATYETHRGGEPEPTRMSYTIEQAKLAKLAGKDNWQKDPEAMLMARASSRLARAVYPDVVGGLLSPDEIEDA